MNTHNEYYGIAALVIACLIAVYGISMKEEKPKTQYVDQIKVLTITGDTAIIINKTAKQGYMLIELKTKKK